MFGVNDVAKAVATRKDRLIKRYASDSNVLCDICTMYCYFFLFLLYQFTFMCYRFRRMKTCVSAAAQAAVC